MRPFNPFKIPVNKEELVLNIDIRKSAVGPLKDSLIFIPTKTIYNVWDNYTNEENNITLMILVLKKNIGFMED